MDPARRQRRETPIRRQAARETLSLPMFAELSADQVAAVADAVRELPNDRS